MKWIFSFCALTIVACGGSDQQTLTRDDKLEELRVHLEERLKAVDPGNRLDSFKLISIDTLSLKDKYGILKEVLSDSLNRVKLRMEVYKELYQANLRLMNLSRRRSSSDYNTYKSEADENKIELERIDSLAKQLELQALLYDSLRDINGQSAPVGYRAVCLYQLRRRDRSVVKDTGNILMNMDKDIIRKEDFLKLH